MARLEIASPHDRRVYEIVDPFVTIGSAHGNHVQLKDTTVAPVHLRIVQVPKGYKVELADTGHALSVNGVSCAAHVLHENDRLQIGDTVLTFLAASPAAVAAEVAEVVPRQTPVRKVRPAPVPGAAPAARPARAASTAAPQRPAPTAGHAHGHSHGRGHDHGHDHPHGHGHAHGHAKKGNPWVIWVSVGAVASVLVVVLLRAMGAGSGLDELGSPDKILEKAEAAFQHGQLQVAQDQCAAALLHNPGAATQERIEELKKKISEQIGRNADQTALDLAKKSLAGMEDFEQKYLAAGVTRPAARSISRTAEAWQKNYRDAVRRYPDTADMADKVEALYVKYSRDAQLDKPDDAGDTLFEVDRRLSLPVPLFRQALDQLDAYVQQHPNDVRGAELYIKRNDIIGAARKEFDRRGAAVKQLIAAHSIKEARKELALMRDAIVAKGWDGEADALEAEINALK